MGAWEDGFSAGWIARGESRNTPSAFFEEASKSKPTSTHRRKRVRKTDPKMARALKKANAMGRKKSGGFKKGWSQGKIMKKAHQLRRKM